MEQTKSTDRSFQHGPVDAFGEWEWETQESGGLATAKATIWREVTSTGALSKTTRCPFCRQGHYHGKGDGHRVPDCPSRSVKPSATLSDGITVYHRDGYIVRTRQTPRPKDTKR